MTAVPSNNRRWPVLAALLWLVFPSIGRADDCKGETPQEHHVGNFNFTTDSRVEIAGKRRVYISCVCNLDADSDLQINWKIPGPYGGWVPAGVAVETPRLEDDVNDRPIDGCLMYGLDEQTKAQFLGTAQDEASNKAEKCGPGSAKSAIMERGALPTGGWASKLRIFFPTDIKDPSNSMIEVNGKIGIEIKDGGYTSFMTYYARPYKGRLKGDVQSVSIEPYFPDKAKPLIEDYLRDVGNHRILGEKGEINFSVSGNPEGYWTAVPAYYQFVSRDGAVLATTPIPLFKLEKQ